MQFDELVDIYLEELYPKFNSVHVSDNGPYRKGKTPDGFKGDIGRPNPELINGNLFPKKKNKKLTNVMKKG